jgi:CelD/BcsL family acetyltransferase involved in cellulose biosynthesis
MLNTFSGSGIEGPRSVKTFDRTFESSGSRIPDPGSHTIEVVTSYSRFCDLEAEWNDAVERARIPHPFLLHEWLRTWWDAFKDNRELHVIVVRDAGRIAGIAPLMRESATVYGLPVRRIALLANDHTPRTDFIVAGNPDDTYTAIWSALLQDLDSWDVLQLTQLLRTSPTIAAMTRFAAAAELAIGTWNSSESPYLELHGTWEEYWESLPAKFRSNVRNRMSRLVKIGEPALEVVSDPGAIEPACADAWRLEKSGWKDDEGTSITSNPSVRQFYTLLAPRATESRWLRLLFLTVGGRRIAVSYGACYDDRLFLFKTGYDREFHACSPFKILTYLATQDAYARGLREVDFLGDTEPWKQEWTAAARGHDWLFVFSNSKRARLLHSIKFQMAPELRKWRA